MTEQYLLVNSHIVDAGVKSAGHGEFVPYGLSILHHALQVEGYQGRMLLGNDDYEQRVLGQEPAGGDVKMIGVTATTWTRFDAIEKIRQCREKFPDSFIVAGGVHFGNCAEDAIQNIPELDAVVKGEADYVVLDLMKYALGEKDLADIEGLTYRNENGEVVSTGGKIVVDQLPALDFINDLYSLEMFEKNILCEEMPIPSMNILAGRGCPFGCIFCSVNRTTYRSYPVKDIVDIIEETTKKYGIRGVKFFDDALTIRPEVVRELCREILDRKLDIRWWCDSRADMDYDLLPLMYEAGCRYVSVGLETGSPKIQKVIGKKISNEKILQFVKRCREVGLSTYVFLMASFPDETVEDLQMTVDVARDLCRVGKSVAGSMGVSVILPGSQLEDIARQRGVLAEDFSWHKPYFEPDNERYESSPTVPLYIEGISPEDFHLAKRKMLANYANNLSLKSFVANAVENLLRRDMTLREKAAIGFAILKSRFLN